MAQASPPTALFYIDEKANADPQAWNATVSLGKPAGVKAFAYLAMAVDADARVEVFGTARTDGTIWWKYQNPNRIVQKTVTITPPGTNTPITVTVNEIEPPQTPWSDWMQLRASRTDQALRNADGASSVRHQPYWSPQPETALHGFVCCRIDGCRHHIG